MKTKRIISCLLAVLMLASAFSLVVAADDAAESTVPKGIDTSNTAPTIDYFTGKETTLVKDDKGEKWELGDKVIFSETDKLNYMTKMLDKDGYVLYVDKFSGEVAVYCKETGEALFSNPYNIADSSANDESKGKLMSQLVIHFTDIETGDTLQFYSYIDAVRDGDDIKGQLVVRNIKNGIRVEYTIGRPESRLLLPIWIEKTRFEEEIQAPLLAAVEASGDPQLAHEINQLIKNYNLQDPSLESSSTVIANMHKQYPITEKAAIYALDSTTSDHVKTKLEQLIKTYCPDYTYEDLDEDHLFTNPHIDDKNPPLFKMALEYTLDASGLTVRLPANGIRFNEALYQLDSVEILPFMGAGAYSNKEGSTFINNGEGYTFYPDGAGSVFRFDKTASIRPLTTVNGKVYGQDYAYHDIKGQLQEVIRYPVFGVVRTEDENLIEYNRAVANGEEVEKPTEKKMNESGFVAVVEEGDALMELTTYHYVPYNYNSVKMTVYPRPKDSYPISDAISVGEAGAEWTVVSSRKYTGNYKIRYLMLSEDGEYDTSYTGMAKAYRDYLEKGGILTRLTQNDVSGNIPLYIQTFGAVETTERFLSIPVDVMTPLTTFDDIVSMYDELSAKGITNINFIMSGYTKGGMTDTQVPYNLKWENNVSDDIDFEELVAYAREKGFGVYPDFDFAYASSNSMFDGLTLSKHAVKTIDDRYTTRREYSATKQTYVSYFDVAVSPAYFSRFYEKLTKNYLEYSPMGISVSTLGNSLNSDFDEDEPYNREDSKNFTIKAMQYLDENYEKVLTSGGNAYTWKYVDYITDVALDSSRYSEAYASVPFLGMVLHGYIQIAGEPLNMEGNIDYAILKAIENGASLNFILSYQNTNTLKNFSDLSKYYSVRYNIWRDDVVSIYNEVNSLLSGIQTSTIVEHEFIEGVRTPDDDELIFDAKETILAAINGKVAYEKALKEYNIDNLRNAKFRVEDIAQRLSDFVAVLEGNTDDVSAQAKAEFDILVSFNENYETIINGSSGKNPLAIEIAERIAKVLKDLKDVDQEFKDLYNRLPVIKREITQAERKVTDAIKAYYNIENVTDADRANAEADADVIALKALYEDYLLAMKAEEVAKAAYEANTADAALAQAYEDAKLLTKTKKTDYDTAATGKEKAAAIATALGDLAAKETELADVQTKYDAKFKEVAKQQLANEAVIAKVEDALEILYSESTYIGDSGYKSKAQDLIKLIVEYVSEAELADQYYEIIVASDMTDVYKADYKAYVDSIHTNIDKILAAIGYTPAQGVDVKQAVVDIFNAQLADMADPANYGNITELLSKTEDAARILPTFTYKYLLPDETNVDNKTDVIITYADLAANDPEKPEEFGFNDYELPTYDTDECKIVLETYENGTKFLLNFNNYTVEVKPTPENGLDRSYTVGAYGYAVIAKAN